MKSDLQICQIQCYPSVLHSVSMLAVEHKQLIPGNRRKNNKIRGNFTYYINITLTQTEGINTKSTTFS